MTSARVLIVEDEAIVAKDLEVRLTAHGYQVIGAVATGADAIEMAGRLTPDIVLMDIRLRGDLDGIEAADRIRRATHRPVVYLTAHADTATVARACTTEPFGYILKPFDERELSTVIEMAIYKHRAEERLRESEERHATTLRSIGDAVIATDAAARVTMMNPVAESLTGWPQAEALGRALTEVFHIVNETSRLPVESPIGKVLATGTTVGLANSTVLIRRDGAEFPIDDCGAPIRDRSGRLTGAVLVFRDVTEAKRLEDLLRQSQKMEAIGRLAGGVAHDFNNLLTVIQGYSTLVADSLQPDHPSRPFAEEVYRAAEKAAALTAQLLAFSRKQMLRPQAFDLNQRIKDLERMFSRLIGAHIRVHLDLSPGLGLTRADPSQVEQIVMNLVVNARDALPNGGELTLRTDVVEGSANAAPDMPLVPGTYHRLSVIDNGVGMNEPTRARVFEPFFTTKEMGKGTGLGLATVFGIVKQSGGHITVASTPGRGTTFAVYLPAAENGAVNVA